MASEEEGLSVLVRVRPTIGDEVSLDQAVTCPTGTNSVQLRTNKHEITCGFDGVLGPSASQTEVYSRVAHVVDAVASGINCTIFAYGQTGSGKTHTMLGAKLEEAMEGGTATFSTAAQGGGTDEDWGIIPRVVVDLFQTLTHGKVDTNSNESSNDSDSNKDDEGPEGKSPRQDFIVHANYMQIYNNTLYDLLSDPRRQNPLLIRETLKASGGKEVFVQGVSEYRVSSARDVLLLLQHGGHNRAVRSTNYNEHSSRSHAILQMTVEVRQRQKPNGPIVTRTAKLNLVDLAGSERWDTSGAGSNVHMRRELTQINTSLSALGNCISRLSEQHYSHVPYRDSQLTRLLEDSLGGNTRTVVVATITLLARDADVTESTLKFADRARQVMVRVKPNRMIDDKALLKNAEEQVARLHKRVLELTEALVAAGVDVPTGHDNGDEESTLGHVDHSTVGSSVGIDKSEMISQLRRENMRLRSENSELRVKAKQQAAQLAAPKAQASAAPYAMPDQVSGPPAALRIKKGRKKHRQRRRKRRTEDKNFSMGSVLESHGRAIDNPYAAQTQKSRGRAKDNLHAEKSLKKPAYTSSPSAPHLPVLSAAVQQKRQISMNRPDAAPSTEEQFGNNNDEFAIDGGEKSSLKMGFAPKDFTGESESSDDDDVDGNSLAKLGFGGGVSLAGRLEARVAEQGDWERNSESHRENDEAAEESVCVYDLRERQSSNELSTHLGPQSPETEAPSQIDPVIPVFASPTRSFQRESVGQSGRTLDRPEKQPRKGKKRSKTSRRKVSKQGPMGSALLQRQTKKEVVMERRRKTQERHQRMRKDIGKRISVYSSRYDEWAPGEIVDIDAERRMHCIQYDEGERRWHRMDMLKFCLG